jgi:MFS family permease
MYPLIASALMIISGFIGLMIGWKPLLQIGLLVLTAGEALAAWSPNMQVFTYGARVLTGVGASMAVPGMLGLIPGLYRGRSQVIAFSAIAAANGIASALGPIASGAIIVTFGWRLAFLVLALLFALSLCGSIVIKTVPKPLKIPKFDLIGAALIIIAMLTMISGLLTVSEWGFIFPMKPPFTLFGLSPSLFFMMFGVMMFWLFLRWQEHIEFSGKPTLLPSLFLRNLQVRAGLYLTALIFLAIGSISFLIITFLQVVVGLNAMQTGLIFAVYAVGMVIFALQAPVLFKRFSPRTLCRAGIFMLVLSCFMMIVGLQSSSTNPFLLVGLFISGAGCGLVASQSSTVITMAIPEHDAEQSGGIQGTMRNLGQAVGVALSGIILIMSLTSAVKTHTRVSDTLSVEAKQQVQLITNVPFLSDEQVNAILDKQTISPQERAALITVNEKSRLLAARSATLFLAFIFFLFLFPTKHLPKASLMLTDPKKDDDVIGNPEAETT